MNFMLLLGRYVARSVHAPGQRWLGGQSKVPWPLPGRAQAAARGIYIHYFYLVWSSVQGQAREWIAYDERQVHFLFSSLLLTIIALSVCNRSTLPALRQLVIGCCGVNDQHQQHYLRRSERRIRGAGGVHYYLHIHQNPNN